MKITIFCSDFDHPVYPYLVDWAAKKQEEHDVEIVSNVKELKSGDFLFLISCSEIVKKDVRSKYDHVLVLHASDLPNGKGWSPHIWEILAGHTELTLTLLEAGDQVDSGRVWAKRSIAMTGAELYDEINDLIFSAEIEMIEWACDNYMSVIPSEQSGSGTYYRKRTPEDSRLNLDGTLRSQINLLRVCDPVRFPAFFDYKGYRYIVKIEKDDGR